MNVLALAEAWWAQHSIHLDQEPGGDRFGTIIIEGDMRAAPLRMVAIGDSMIAGCGVDDQAHGFTPDLAAVFSRVLNRSIAWESYGKLGATVRRVRYRLLPEVEGRADLLVLCAGSNDLMARRSLEEWRTDLAAAIDEAKRLSDNIVVFSAGQLYRSPSLGKALRQVIKRMTDEQTAASKAICEQKQVLFLDMTHEDVHADQERFYAHDNFHPSDYGYSYMAECTATMAGDWLKARLG